MAKSKKKAPKHVAKATNACAGQGKKKGGKFRRRREKAKQGTACNTSTPVNGLMQCYENARHTGSVSLRRIPFVDSALDKHISEEPDSREFRKTKKGKLKKLRKQANTVVITSSSSDFGAGGDEGQEDGADQAPGIMIQVIYVKPLIVLDLNGILCRRIRYNKLSVQDGERISFRPSVGHIAGTPVVAREDLKPMLSYLDANFTLAVWTSAKLTTARGLIQMLFDRDIARRLLFVWGQDKCDATRPAEEESAGGNDGEGDTASDEPNSSDKFDIIFEKSLGKVWGRFGLWDASNTLLIDDSPEKARKWIENTLHPPPITGIVADTEGVESSDLANEISQRRFFEGLANHFQQSKVDNGKEMCSNMAVESSDDRQERRRCACRSLYSFLKEHKEHMGWRGETAGASLV